ncbi:glycosyltransferase [Candidatus Photodesmus katoptron Akat1]|uniref:Glycosyltransferase n=1 Tax=Candidatus Photodesmus katoptron Akat1 TaxID=1236703 RepID=S3DJS5_9GAMM|nr:glycosyltransferase [Candidatus Photodesmus katoptron Akat1]
MKRDLIVFGEDFNGLPSSTQYLIKNLSHNRKVLWINSIGLRQPKLNLIDIKRSCSKIFCKKQTDSLLKNITVVNLKTIPAPHSILGRKIAKYLMLYQLKPILKQLQLNKPILWCSLPTAVDLCGYLGESKIIYYCGDDFNSLAGVDHNSVIKHEQKMIKKANLIFSASKEILLKFPISKRQLLPHGVEFKLFNTPVPRAIDLPNNGRPTAGFYGSISNWLDYEMLDKVTKNNQNWNFVFIGPQQLKPSLLPTYKNVYYLGKKQHHQLPQYSQHWNVSLLPFKLNPQILSCNPLKLMEYLVVGNPIISTPFPALTPFKHLINIVKNSEEMSRVLLKPLKKTSII